MEFRFLGPVEALHDGEPMALGGRQRQALLALLGSASGRPVSADRLIDELWPGEPPPAARKTLQAHLAHLKRAVNTGGDRLRSTDSGYVLAVDGSKVDTRSFESGIERAREEVEKRPDLALTLLDEALILWRGRPYGGLGDRVPALEVEAQRLEELRISAIEDRFDLALASRAPGPLAVELGRLVRDHPLRERLRGQHMLALYRSGRQAAALRSYDTLRRLLAEDIGIEPSPELQHLAQRIREQDPALGMAEPPLRWVRRSNHRLGFALGAVALVAASALVTAALMGRDDPDTSATTPSTSTAALTSTGPGGLIANLTANELSGYGWPAHAELEVVIEGHSSITVPTGLDGEFRLPLAAQGVTLTAGGRIGVTHETGTTEMITVDLTFDVVDLPGARLEGSTTAPDGSWMTVWILEPGRSLDYATFAEDGLWAVAPAEPMGPQFEIIVAINAHGGQTDFKYRP